MVVVDGPLFVSLRRRVHGVLHPIGIIEVHEYALNKFGPSSIRAIDPHEVWRLHDSEMFARVCHLEGKHFPSLSGGWRIALRRGAGGAITDRGLVPATYVDLDTPAKEKREAEAAEAARREAEARRVAVEETARREAARLAEKEAAKVRAQGETAALVKRVFTKVSTWADQESAATLIEAHRRGNLARRRANAAARALADEAAARAAAERERAASAEAEAAAAAAAAKAAEAEKTYNDEFEAEAAPEPTPPAVAAPAPALEVVSPLVPQPPATPPARSGGGLRSGLFGRKQKKSALSPFAPAFGGASAEAPAPAPEPAAAPAPAVAAPAPAPDAPPPPPPTPPAPPPPPPDAHGGYEELLARVASARGRARGARGYEETVLREARERETRRMDRLLSPRRDRRQRRPAAPPPPPPRDETRERELDAAVEAALAGTRFGSSAAEMDTLRDALDPSAVSRWDFEHALLVRQQLLVLENERLRLAAGVAEAEAAALAGHPSAAALQKPWRGATATRKVSHVSAASQNAVLPWALYAARPKRSGAARESSFGTLAPLAGESWLSESASVAWPLPLKNALELPAEARGSPRSTFEEIYARKTSPRSPRAASPPRGFLPNVSPRPSTVQGGREAPSQPAAARPASRR